MSSSQRLEFAAGHSVTDSESLTRCAPPGDDHARNSPHCALLVSSFAVRSCQLTLLEPGKGFGFHLTAIPGHENTGFLSTEGIEEMFIFDWFMDCNVGFFTSSLDSPIEMLSKLSWSGLLPSRVAETGADLPEQPQGC